MDLGVFALLHARIGIVPANLVSTGAGMTVSFLANGRFTFGVRRPGLGQALRFAATTGTVLWILQPLAIATLAPATGVLPAKVLATAACVVVNYLACRHLVWRGVRSARPPSGRGAAPSAARR